MTENYSSEKDQTRRPYLIAKTIKGKIKTLIDSLNLKKTISGDKICKNPNRFPQLERQ